MAFAILEFADSAFDRGGDNSGGNSGGQHVTTTTPNLPPPPDGFDTLKGESMTVLFVITDYLPSIYNDYEYADKRPDGFDGEVREVETDIVILARINKETGEAIFCPIPTITQITINGHATTLNKLYSKRGITALREQVTSLTGLPIDFHMIATLDAISTIVDSLGGLEFHVPKNMNYADLDLGIEIDLMSGTQSLGGSAVYDMLLYSSLCDDDASRQRLGCNFLKAMIKEFVTKIPMNNSASVYLDYSDHITSDFTANEMSENADLIYTFTKLAIKDYTYPGTTTGTGADTVFTPNSAKAMEFFDPYKFKG